MVIYKIFKKLAEKKMNIFKFVLGFKSKVTGRSVNQKNSAIRCPNKNLPELSSLEN